ncbi:uracil-DNA glycosylase [Natribacillus halophilus]|uniref:Uracil-DNA glycosylase n=1 Tax=Natribacillus halophilus TaxID=549003 RepID=A0A1G8L062_9BACI|nr:uracil-DNA glycosylase [Natribacillus halophilus]SDI49125.1 Uracil-DNA glycosylase [Natribacillus halophilus]
MNTLKVPLDNDWSEHLHEEFTKDYYQQLRAFLKKEYAEKSIYPDMFDIFNALHYTSYENTKVVILGQDPYHGPMQAHGLSFSVQPGVKLPPSLRNIFQELVSDIGCEMPENGDLRGWARQGVLLLNTVLTVRAHEAASHQGKGWETFTDQVIKCVSAKTDPVVFILWGRHAQKKVTFIESQHAVLRSPHPSPLAAHNGFFGSRPFSKTNAFLERSGRETIQWCASGVEEG